MEKFFDVIKEFVSLPICLIFVSCLQILKKILEMKNIKPKNNIIWFYITLAMGFPLALLSIAMTGFSGFNWAKFIIQGFGYAGGCTIIYATIRQLDIKAIKNLFSNHEDNK
jgi:hypothetical protein